MSSKRNHAGRERERERELHDRLEETQIRLAEAEETLRAIREGEVDAVVVSGSKGEQIFSLTGSESVYRLIVQTMGEAALTATPGGTILFCNAQFGELLARPVEHVMGRSLHEFTAPESRELVEALLASSCSQPIEERLVLLGSHGRMVPVRVSANLLQQPEGPSICLVVTDLTELEKTHESLKHQSELLETVIHNIPVMLAMYDESGQMLLWNRELERKSGWSATEAGSMDIMEALYLDPEQRRSVREFMAAAEPGVWRDIAMTARDGSGLESSWTNVRISGGRTIGIGLDVTERKRAEWEREQLQEQLHQSQKMEAVGRLAGGVAHDFNNLMTVVSGYTARVLRQLPLHSPLHGEIQQVKMAGDRAAELTRQLLAFSRKQVMRMEVLNLDRVIAGIVPMIERLLGEDVRIEQTCAGRPQMVRADRGQIEQVLMNLAVNARDAMPAGGTLRIETGERDLDAAAAAALGVVPGRYSTLAVSDTGSGMPPEVLAHLFEPFFTTKPVGQGTGLGLATVHGIVKQSEGGIEAWSEPGRGARFTILLPRHEAAEASASDPKAGPAAATAAKGETVLVVEDDESVLNLVRKNLEDLGYSVLAAANLAQAEELLGRTGADVRLLLTDVVLPEASGPEVHRALAARRPGLKVLYMSGYDRGQVISRGILEPGTAFIEKPFSNEELAASVRAALKRA